MTVCALPESKAERHMSILLLTLLLLVA